MGFGSVCVQRQAQIKKIRPHTEPIYASTAFLFDSPKEAMDLFGDPSKGYIYSRWSNPTVEMAEQKIATLETLGSDLRARSQLFGSGMAAISALILSCLQKGEKLLAQFQLYGTTDEFLETQLGAWGMDVMRCDMHDFGDVERMLKKDGTIKLLYIETPSNPMLGIYDIAKLSSLAKKYGCRLAVDNTFASPFCQQPLLLGADFSVQSATKYLNGHGTGLGGVVTGTDKQFMKQVLWRKVKLLGGNSNAFDAWLILQGLKTLELRMQRHCENAMRIAEYLQGHRQVKRVFYCGLKTHPQYALAKKQMHASGGMLSFELKGGLRSGIALMGRVKLCRLATTLGTTDTLIQHPASMTHVNVPRARRIKAGISDGLVRLSAGLENAEDIIEDLARGLKSA